MRSAQMCRTMLALSLTFKLFQPLRAAAQESPSPTYTLPSKDRAFECTAVPGGGIGPCALQSYPKGQGPYDCAEMVHLNKYTDDREARIRKLQEELLTLAQDEGVQRRKMQQAQHDIDSTTNLDALHAARTALIKAETMLKYYKDLSLGKLNEIEALKEEMKQTVDSYNQTVTSNAGKCQCYVVDDRTGKCICTKERYDRAVREGNNARVCGGGTSR